MLDIQTGDIVDIKTVRGTWLKYVKVGRIFLSFIEVIRVGGKYGIVDNKDIVEIIKVR